jgi:hypothetical protein
MIWSVRFGVARSKPNRVMTILASRAAWTGAWAIIVSAITERTWAIASGSSSLSNTSRSLAMVVSAATNGCSTSRSLGWRRAEASGESSRLRRVPARDWSGRVTWVALWMEVEMEVEVEVARHWRLRLPRLSDSEHGSFPGSTTPARPVRDPWPAPDAQHVRRQSVAIVDGAQRGHPGPSSRTATSQSTAPATPTATSIRNFDKPTFSRTPNPRRRSDPAISALW